MSQYLAYGAGECSDLALARPGRKWAHRFAMNREHCSTGSKRMKRSRLLGCNRPAHLRLHEIPTYTVGGGADLSQKPEEITGRSAGFASISRCADDFSTRHAQGR